MSLRREIILISIKLDIKFKTCDGFNVFKNLILLVYSNLLGASVVVTGDSVVVMTSSLTAVTTAEKPPRPTLQSDLNTTITSLDETLSCLATVTSPTRRFVPPDCTSYTVTWSAPFSTSTSSKLTNKE